MTRFEKGNPGGPGRPLGSPNKTNAMLREAFLNAFDDLGGQEWLVEEAKKDPRTFVRCVTKMLPREATVHTDQPLIFQHPDLSPERKAEIKAEEQKAVKMLLGAAKRAGMDTDTPAGISALISLFHQGIWGLYDLHREKGETQDGPADVKKTVI